MATLGVYWHVTNHEFINYDDDLYVTDNHNVQAGLRLESITWSFTATHASNWHPLTWMSHMLDCQLFGMNPGWHHLTNLFFHIANALLLFLAFKRMTGDSWQSGFVAALFALHPLHVESVAWVAERKDVLSAFFWMLTVWSYIWYLERPRVSRYLRVLFFFILGLMAKPMLVTLPFVLLLLDYWPLGRFQFGRSGGEGKSRQRAIALRLVWEKIPLFILAVASSFVTFLVQQSGGAVRSLDALSLDVRISNTLVSYVSYIGKMIWPYHLAVLYPHPGNLPMSQIAVACLLLISISFLAIMAVRQRPYFAVGWLWYIGTLVPVIGLVQVGIQSFADRYTYVPLIGIFIIIAWGFPDIVSKCRHKEIGITIIVGALLSIFMVTTWLQVRYWNNNMTLFEHALDVTANNYLAHNNLGNALNEQGDRAEAIRHYSEALRINPTYWEAHYNLGNALTAQGRTAEAIRHFSEALRLNPGFAEAHNNLGFLLAEQGDRAEAIRHYSEALRIKPNYAKVHNNLGNALVAQGKLKEAIKHYSEAVSLDHDFAEAYNNLGAALFRTGKIEEAIAHFQEALRTKPNDPNTSNNLKMALAAKRGVDEAIAETKEKLRLNPEDPALHYKLGELYNSKGELDDAIDQYQKALSIQPGFAQALHSLSIVYAIKGQYDQAISSFKKIIELLPENDSAYYNIACMYAQQNEIEKSIDWLKKAINRGYNNWELIKTDKDLENIRGSSYYKELIKGH